LKSKATEVASLIEAERLFFSLSEVNWSVAILRVAEIYGPDEELSKRLKTLNGPLPGSGTAYTNMIHRSDVIAAIDYCIRHQLEGIYNLVDDEHPTREQLYRKIAEKCGFAPFTWNSNYNSGWHEVNKRVSNHKIKAAGFSLKYSQRVLD
jgi:nucleoside-diphosphate-sugar epimerase